MDQPLANTACYPGTPGVRRRLERDVGQAEIRDRIPGFHTDFTQTDRSGPRTPRRPGQPHNAQMPMKSQITATSAGFPAPRPIAKNRHPSNGVVFLFRASVPSARGGGMRTLREAWV